MTCSVILKIVFFVFLATIPSAQFRTFQPNFAAFATECTKGSSGAGGNDESLQPHFHLFLSDIGSIRDGMFDNFQ